MYFYMHLLTVLLLRWNAAYTVGYLGMAGVYLLNQEISQIYVCVWRHEDGAQEFVEKSCGEQQSCRGTCKP